MSKQMASMTDGHDPAMPADKTQVGDPPCGDPQLGNSSIGDAPATSLSPLQASTTLSGLQQELNRLQRSIRLAIQERLGAMAGTSLGTLAANRELVQSIHTMLESHGLRVRCIDCGHPAILRISTRPGCASGVFVLDHTIDGRRTFHGGKTVMPQIHLVAKPARKKRAPAKPSSRVAS